MLHRLSDACLAGKSGVVTSGISENDKSFVIQARTPTADAISAMSSTNNATA